LNKCHNFKLYSFSEDITIEWTQTIDLHEKKNTLFKPNLTKFMVFSEMSLIKADPISRKPEK